MSELDDLLDAGAELVETAATIVDGAAIGYGLDELLLALEAARDLGLDRLELELPVGARLSASWAPPHPPERPAPAPVRPVDRRERLAWTMYAPELREALKALAATYPPELVADAAAELELLVALHGRPAPRPPR